MYFISFFLLTALLVLQLASGYQINYVGGTNVNVNDMIVDFEAQVAYISGCAFLSAYGQPQFGSVDAIMLKVNLLNGSLIWARQFGSTSGDFGAVLQSNQQSGWFIKGICFTHDGQIAMAFTVGNVIIGMQYMGGHDSLITLFFANGSHNGYIVGFSSTNNDYHIDLISNPSVDRLYLAQISVSFASLTQIFQVFAQNRSRSLVYQCGYMIVRGMKLLPNLLLAYGHIDGSLFGQSDGVYGLFALQLSLTNFSVMQAFSLPGPSFSHILDSFLDAESQMIYLTGQLESQFPFSQVGTGGFVVFRWSLINSTFETLIRSFGTTDCGSNIHIESFSKNIIVSGKVSGSYAVNGADYDAVILVFAKNLTLLNQTILGGPLSDYGSTIVYPYILISNYGNNGARSGPALLKLQQPQLNTVSSMSLTASKSSQTSSSLTFQTSTSSLLQTSSNFYYNISSEELSLTFIDTVTLSSLVYQSQSSYNLSATFTTFLGLLTSSQDPDFTLNQLSSIFQASSQSKSSSMLSVNIPASTAGYSLFGFSLLTVIIVGIGACATLCVIVALCYWCRRSKRVKQVVALQDGTAILEETTTQSTFFANSTTILATGHVISAPGFCILEEGHHTRYMFPPIAEGGGGVIMKAEIILFPNQNPFKGSGIRFCVAKQMKQTSQNAFLQEVALMWHFNGSKCIVPLIGYTSQTKTLLMPFYELGSLDQLIQGKSMPELIWSFEAVLILAIDIFDALNAIHNAGVIHCDVKSQNFLVEFRDGLMHTLLTDFGICQILSSASTVSGIQWNVLKGKSIQYAAPELHQQNATPSRLWYGRDIYAASLILCELLTRQLVWKGMNNDDVVKLVLEGQRPQLDPVACELSSRIDLVKQLIVQGWSQDASQRPQAQVFMESLLQL